MAQSGSNFIRTRAALRFTQNFPHASNHIFVCSVNGTDASGNGYSPDVPVATIDYAIGLCTAAKGDVVHVLPGHAETIATASAITVDISGLNIIGYGEAANKPVITYGTLTTTTTVISAANCIVRNLRFLNAIDSLAAFVTVSADDVTIEDCEFVGGSTVEVLNAIGITTTKDNTIIRRCKFIQPTDPTGTNANAGTGAIYLVDSENVLVEGCEFRGNWETAFIHNKTSAAANLWIKNCYGICSLADAQPVLLVTTATGGMDRCSFITPAETQVTEATLSGTFGAGFFNFQSYFGNDGGGGQLAVASQSVAS